MITDVFPRRYSKTKIRDQYYEEDRRFLNQASTIMLSGRLWDGGITEKVTDHAENSFKQAHDTLALELGVEFLSDRWIFRTTEYNGNKTTQSYKNSYATICKNFLIKAPSDLSLGDAWVKDRIGLIEIAFSLREKQLALADIELPQKIRDAERAATMMPSPRVIRVPGNRVEAIKTMHQRRREVFSELVIELNERMKLALYKLTYNNGLIQISDDELTSSEIEEPFWPLISQSPWENVDIQMKEAIDCRDTGDRMAAFHAVSALESCIKIISQSKGWSTGKEKGAANFVDNLVSKNNGGFISVWESEVLKSLFSNVRNPFAHGAGSSEMPTLTVEQTNWTIETAMTWIKSLIRRL
ncbi:conserved protein of unknown function [uncultured Sphingopyxis sp.]|uniref:Uncharacterized protein n=1 Tax=uncultured Sphingopyxis sp. TaxID=310581 RepID=A0A1Y5PU51_9SPHN|nr:hypothetical protein [uncultured Sphingopyxis sp.]SBV32226.1 conserved protein of unknown function [uncultured Sphingopyxis sp.]